MKRKFILMVSTGLFFLSGCATPQSVPQKKDTPCVSCATEKVKPVDFGCKKITKVVYYEDKCNSSCEFPVTVRTTSNCSGGKL